MRLSERNSLYKNRYWFLRFGDEKSHLESLQNGNLRYSPLKRYADIEKATGKKGVGDRHEASMVVSEVDVSIYHEATGEFITKIPAEETALNINHISQRPVFCLYALNGDDLEITGEDERFYFVRTVFEEEDKKLLQKDFGEHVFMILSTPVFLDRLVTKMHQKEISVAHGLVRYDDYSKNSEERWSSYKKDERNVLFWKDARYFKHQKEYRIVLNTLITEPTCYDIGDIHDITSYMTREQLFTEGFHLAIEKDIS